MGTIGFFERLLRSNEISVGPITGFSAEVAEKALETSPEEIPLPSLPISPVAILFSISIIGDESVFIKSVFLACSVWNSHGEQFI
jgi:hypothetical protein